ncbi:hypothetical protein FVE85_2013 [Porphyridium purpureum]|uniref:Uncharacterized protein n=1 Tax=Porphyridium purpureum TaxID=35688 RepID=A0A5J4YXH4_PORPP|nr:hypothetical protein FVE85_2013 [Porphyridium purpureum]|eukprot:POR8680..scf209_3
MFYVLLPMYPGPFTCSELTRTDFQFFEPPIQSRLAFLRKILHCSALAAYRPLYPLSAWCTAPKTHLKLTCVSLMTTGRNRSMHSICFAPHAAAHNQSLASFLIPSTTVTPAVQSHLSPPLCDASHPFAPGDALDSPAASQQKRLSAVQWECTSTCGDCERSSSTVSVWQRSA